MSSNIKLIQHPIAEHNLSILRDKKSDSEKFRTALKRLSYLLIYEAAKNLPTKVVNVETPIACVSSKQIDDNYNIIVAPILRAGLVFSDTALEILPMAQIQHIGMYRDEETLKPVWYYDKTPIEYEKPEKNIVIVLDPMLATGNSSIDTLKLFTNKKIQQNNLIFGSLIASESAINKISAVFPDVTVLTFAIDKQINNKGYIVPGLGDAGDRIFNTI